MFVNMFTTMLNGNFCLIRLSSKTCKQTEAKKLTKSSLGVTSEAHDVMESFADLGALL